MLESRWPGEKETIPSGGATAGSRQRIPAVSLTPAELRQIYRP